MISLSILHRSVQVLYCIQKRRSRESRYVQALEQGPGVEGCYSLVFGLVLTKHCLTDELTAMMATLNV
jgi:hypothetical protein